MKRRRAFSLFELVLVIISTSAVVTNSLSATTTKQPLAGQLQRCFTPQDVLSKVGTQVNPEVDPLGTVSSLILVRLLKLMIALDNNGHENWQIDMASQGKTLSGVVNSLAQADWKASSQALDAAVEGTKAASAISRVLPDIPMDTWEPLMTSWNRRAKTIVSKLQPHHLSGLEWCSACFQLRDQDFTLPAELQNAYNALNIPFRINVGCLQDMDGLSVENLVQQVDFQVEQIRTTSNRVVKERRQTAWEGDDHVAAFEYSGKSMERKPWSPLVRSVRDRLVERTGVYYDGCLLNLYPDGGSGMRYHIDPDQGTMWGFETVVVSVGATRRFAFRNIPGTGDPQAKPHTFVVMQSDVTVMFADCQEGFQHTVKTADDKNEVAPRSSLVFKKTLESSTREQSSS
jgi:alkylated DNA repair dioxygenase AlkB